MERLRLDLAQVRQREAQLLSEREQMEEDVSGMRWQREELQAQKAKVASLEEQVERQHREAWRFGAL